LIAILFFLFIQDRTLVVERLSTNVRILSVSDKIFLESWYIERKFPMYETFKIKNDSPGSLLMNAPNGS
jgi:hypothetical protein